MPGAAFFGSVAPMISRFFAIAPLALEHLHDHRTGGHVVHEVLEERTLAVHGIETFGLALRQMHHARGDDPEAGLFEAAEDLADQVTGNAVGLDDGQGALERHGFLGLRNGVNKAADSSLRGAHCGNCSRARKCPSGKEKSDAEALAAAALALDVGVVEAEGLVEALFDEIDLGAVDERQALGVDEDLDALSSNTRSPGRTASA